MGAFLDKAICFAVYAHSGAARKGTDIPYIVHPLEAVAIASSLTSNEEVLAAAVLHDTIEDTSVTAEDISREFGDRVCSLVLFDSEDKREAQPSADTWEQRKRETLDALNDANRDEQIIVLADKLSNMRAVYRDFLRLSDSLWKRFNQKDPQKQAWYYLSIADKLTELIDTPAYDEYVALLNKVFGSR